MRSCLYSILCLLLLHSCNLPQTSDSTQVRPRIGIIGLGATCSTFSPAETTLEQFESLDGADLLASYPFLLSDSVLRLRAEWIPTKATWASAGGSITRQTYDTLVTELLKDLEENAPYDGLLLDLRGAMSVHGIEDPEGYFVKKVRDIVGDSTLISTTMDVYGAVTQQLAQKTDLITANRTIPTTDRQATHLRAITDLLERLEQGLGRPKYKAWVKVPIILPSEKIDTNKEPAQSLFAHLKVLDRRKGITNTGIWLTYPWADNPRTHATVMITGDDKIKVSDNAKQLAKELWDVREKFKFEAHATTFDRALDQALSSNKAPFLISDMGDDPTIGGVGDVTWTLERLLRHPKLRIPSSKSVIYASIFSPQTVAQAQKAGVGGKIVATAGAEIDSRYADPLKLKGHVKALYTDSINDQAVISVGSIEVIVTQHRTAFHHEADFERLGLNLRKTDVVIIKMSDLPKEFSNICSDWVMAHTPGSVNQEIEQLPYQNIERPIFPFDYRMSDPPLSVILY